MDDQAGCGGITVWAMWKENKPVSFGRTWRDLLIGYDLMPLRGLEITAKVLAERHGMIAKLTRVEIGLSDTYAVAWRDQPCLSALVYSVVSSEAERTAMIAARWLQSEYILTETENRHASYFGLLYRDPHNILLPLDKRRRSTLQSSREHVRTALYRRELSVVTIQTLAMEEE